MKRMPTWEYHFDADTLLIMLTPEPTWAREVAPGVHIRCGVLWEGDKYTITDRAAGAEIRDYSLQDKAKLKTLLPFEFDFAPVEEEIE